MSSAMRTLSSLAAGLLFGFGLALSGMMNPARVLGFLDFAGQWDPSLAFVLAGAVGVSSLGYFVRTRMTHPALSDEFHVPGSQQIDAKLLLGAALFGIGWGLVGLCPGPALAGLSLGLLRVLVFVIAMLIGMLLYRLLAERPAVSTP
jgi:uncharacterized protein